MKNWKYTNDKCEIEICKNPKEKFSGGPVGKQTHFAVCTNCKYRFWNIEGYDDFGIDKYIKDKNNE